MSTATALQSGELRVTEVADAKLWDSWLLSFPGVAHPLQTSAWGEAKRSIGEHIQRWSVLDGDAPVLLAQVFEKAVGPLHLRVAWVPRGPVFAEDPRGREAFHLWKKAMASRGFHLCAYQPYRATSAPPGRLGIPLPLQREFTFLLDLSLPIETLDRTLDKEWRYGKNRFLRDGGKVVEETAHTSGETLETLIAMLNDLSRRKGFDQYGDADLVRAVHRSFSASTNPAISAHLFRAVVAGKTAGCALVLRVGDIAHYHWGAFDYELRNSRVNEGMQWAIINRLRELKVLLYDLEGADLKRNPGVFHFKQKMGGRLVAHAPYQLSITL